MNARINTIEWLKIRLYVFDTWPILCQYQRHVHLLNGAKFLFPFIPKVFDSFDEFFIIFFPFVLSRVIVSQFYYWSKNKKTLNTWRCSEDKKKQYINSTNATIETFNVLWWIINWPMPKSKWQLKTNAHIYLETISRNFMTD